MHNRAFPFFARKVQHTAKPCLFISLRENKTCVRAVFFRFLRGKDERSGVLNKQIRIVFRMILR